MTATITNLSEFRETRLLAAHRSTPIGAAAPVLESFPTDRSALSPCDDATGNSPASTKPAGSSLQPMPLRVGDRVLDRLTRALCRVTFVEHDSDGNASMVWLVRRTAPHGMLGQSRPAAMVERLAR